MKQYHISFKSIFFLLFSVFLLFVPSSCQSEKNRAINYSKKTAEDESPKSQEMGFDKWTKPLLLTEKDGITAVKEIASVLTEKKKAADLPKIFETPGNCSIVFISASDGESPATVAAGSGESLKTAVDDALIRFSQLYGKKKKTIWFRLDFVSDVQSVNDLNSIELGEKNSNLMGIAFRGSVNKAVLPVELISRGFIDSKGKIKAGKLQWALTGESGTPERNQKKSVKKQSEIYTFETRSFFTDGNVAYPLFRGHRMLSKLTPEEVLQAAEEGGEYLISSLHPDGKFDYIYYPYLNRTSKDYNILRHAGTVYSMLELYEITGNEKLLIAARKAITYLLSYVSSFKTKNGIISTVIFRGKIFLGANAVTVLALAKYTAVTKDKRYLIIAQNIARWMQYTQEKNGSFRIHLQDFPGGKIYEKVTLYYPGEAIFALTRLHQVDGNPVWLRVAEKAAHYQINTYHNIKREDKIEVDHWLIFACNELYKHSKKPEYVTFSLQLADEILKTQCKKSDIPDWVGSFYDPPRCTPTATRMEGLIAASEIAGRAGKKEKLQAFFDSIILGVKFQLQSQIRPETAMFMKKPQKSLGGFMRTLTGPDVRIDYNQHNISSLVGLYKLMKLKNGKN